MAPTSVLPKRFYIISGSKQHFLSAGTGGDNRNNIHLKFDPILESPSLLFSSQSEPAIDDLIELNEGLKELWVGLGFSEVVAEEGSELPKTVQTASCNHIKQFFGGECDGRRLNGT